MTLKTVDKPAEFHGWHMFAIMLVFFGVIIAVNLTMAVMASKSWTGLIVKNSYVASQNFNDELSASKAQAARGWKSSVSYSAGILTARISGRNGNALAMDNVSVHIGRPAYEGEDFVSEFLVHDNGNNLLTVNLGVGLWALQIEGKSGDMVYRRDVRLFVREDGVGVIK